MYQYRFLEHTADIRIQLEGDAFADLFAAGVHAIAEILKPGFCKDQSLAFTHERSLKLEAIDKTALLIDFLSDVLTQSHMDQAIYCVVRITHLSGTGIDAVILGSQVDLFEDDIKAVTYHEADVRQEGKGNWSCMVIVDI